MLFAINVLKQGKKKLSNTIAFSEKCRGTRKTQIASTYGNTLTEVGGAVRNAGPSIIGCVVVVEALMFAPFIMKSSYRL